jgi:hypothetical protein
MSELAEICREWLYENFGIEAEVTAVRLLEKEEIDRKLGLIGVAFEFIDSDSGIGDGVAFFREEEVRLGRTVKTVCYEVI